MNTNSENKKVVGILGGMGPEATVDLLRRIVLSTSAEDDADHVHCLVDQNPHVPSRIKALLEGGDVSPGPCLAEMAVKLEKGGADFLCMACNTAHNWYADVAAAVNVPVLNIIEIASIQAASMLGKGGRIGILASPAVRLTRLYEGPCANAGLVTVYADEKEERDLLNVIRDIKAGRRGRDVVEKFERIIRHLQSKGAQALIIACTELGMLDYNSDLPVIDAADALAKTIVEKAGAKLASP